MAEAVPAELAGLLIETWKAQARDGFLLLDPENHEIEERSSTDPNSDVQIESPLLTFRLLF